jgi:hypothetical protein
MGNTTSNTFMGPVQIIDAVNANLSTAKTSFAHMTSAIHTLLVTIEDLTTNFALVTLLSTSRLVCSNPVT